VRYGIVGIDPQRRLELADHLLGAALLRVGQTQAEVRVGMVGVRPQRRLELTDRLLSTALLLVGRSQEVVRVAIIWSNRSRGMTKNRCGLTVPIGSQRIG
jgi:hypothetical protein